MCIAVLAGVILGSGTAIGLKLNSIYNDYIEVDNDKIIAYRRRLDKIIIDCYYSFSNQPITIKIKEKYDVVFQNLDDIDLLNETMSLKPFHAVLLKVREKNG